MKKSLVLILFISILFFGCKEMPQDFLTKVEENGETAMVAGFHGEIFYLRGSALLSTGWPYEKAGYNKSNSLYLSGGGEVLVSTIQNGEHWTAEMGEGEFAYPVHPNFVWILDGETLSILSNRSSRTDYDLGESSADFAEMKATDRFVGIRDGSELTVYEFDGETVELFQTYSLAQEFEFSASGESLFILESGSRNKIRKISLNEETSAETVLNSGIKISGFSLFGDQLFYWDHEGLFLKNLQSGSEIQLQIEVSSVYYEALIESCFILNESGIWVYFIGGSEFVFIKSYDF